MEAQYIPPSEPQFRRRPNSNPRDPAAVVQQQGPQVVLNQQPHPRKTNRADPRYHGDVQQYAPTGHGYGGYQGQVQEPGRVRPTQPGKRLKNKNPNLTPPAGVNHKETKKTKQSSEFPGNPTDEILVGSPTAVSHALVDHYGNYNASGRSDGYGSALSRLSQDGSLHGQSQVSDHDSSGSGRTHERGSNRAGDQRLPTGTSRLNPSVASNGGSHRLTANVLRSLDNNQPQIAPLNINSTTNDPTHAEDFSMIVYPGEKQDMETQIFDVPRGSNRPAITEGPIYRRQGEHPHPQQRRFIGNRHPPQPAPQGPHAQSPLHHQQQQQPTQPPSIYTPGQVLVQYVPDVKTMPEPNAKCIACVHTVGVPIARLGTRILCRSAKGGCAFVGCTIL
ncbi:uncharacterized protein [Physcomitrium patens]|uniref:Uncharacterized protein n=1 Tax=Physcomitrium patens TaxID=3218 RepID=A9RJF3_PHYPA|nr:uncharacterized protein LOC112274822 [Physcomitrium patens]XP_024360366.1 uncharacterized protein LOC112274822 [Physcomitrium patens]XP_024360368.1 uncharacterized protein LOC112274822 [Physcomitrium patens]XP_024360369.1 uncharacterized protein LOC112274822 [Physcomitrium patens]XP_024360370.1 uncharacterized protein LOC112274822 [Physcomitrium patens]XP_024360371.1 uncharacterized protein LOC112274822 [Physcomitrium patens]XP_024360372.1 uncharacterized protein LOC112274822 [Physcomitriu|eukprot:XP_024360365.1 uncharacterized protein LOC112274822 [Physcomitrella patens]